MSNWKNLAAGALLLGAVALGSDALAQAGAAPNPVLAHFRAYRAAVAHNDMAAAETEAAAALEASVARDGDGGSTGVLAINLAQARLTLGKRDEAYAPALRAFTISTSSQGHVDPLLARLVLGRAELTQARWREGTARLDAALPEAAAKPDMNVDTYAAAADLGVWYSGQQQYTGAQRAWEIAKRSADAAGTGNDYIRAEARMGHASALFVQVMEAVAYHQARPTDTRLGLHNDNAFDAADQELAEAETIIGPTAYVDGGAEISVGQRMYATALAWRTLLEAFARSRGMGLIEPHETNFEVSTSDSREVCKTHVVAEPPPRFPTMAQAGFATGAVVMRVRIDATGHVIDTKTAGAAPSRWFVDAVERVAPQWRFELGADSPPNCRYPPIRYVPVRFAFQQ